MYLKFNQSKLTDIPKLDIHDETLATFSERIYPVDTNKIFIRLVEENNVYIYFKYF